MFNRKKILITGGTGSFGNAFLEYLLKFNCSINIFSRDELKQHEMRVKFNSKKINFFLGDIRDKHEMEKAIIGVDYIFHAAALKQVPSCEFFPMEAVKTNVLGINNLIDLAIKHNVKKIIALSTDKAVYPINAMGLSKSLMEKVIVSRSRINKKKISMGVVRYGNVLFSRGSVLPLFIKQAKDQKSLTLTDPNMTRFFISMKDAISLVIHAFKNVKNGETFILKAKSARMLEVAEMINKIFNNNKKIKILGPRHGEKTHETLATKYEISSSKESKNFFEIKVDDRDLNYEKYFTVGNASKVKYKDFDSENSPKITSQELKKIIRSLNNS
ncbi:polysaccharide biosynthesis protein [Candidatus Pelagibacter sp.]|nr:polysaccharide biosynthesis protein [Candidatus Pelagibacter sp.]